MRRLHATELAILGLLFLLLLLSYPAAAQQVELDWYVTIPNVPGCSTAQGQAGKIDVLELHQLWFSAESTGPVQPQTREFIFSKDMDCTTRLLWDNYRTLTHFSSIVLEGYDRTPFHRLRQRIELYDTYIQSLETSDRFPDDPPLERIRWAYGTVELASYCVLPDGSDCGQFESSFDFSQVP